jgi:hypothetical protein
MTEDLATQSLGIIPTPTTLQERRQQYDDWLLTGRRVNRPMGLMTRTDEKLSPVALAEKRAKAGGEAAASLINPLPPGAVVRTDEGNTEANPSDDVRLSFGKALLAKAEGADGATAAIIANAANAILGPIVRTDAAQADDDADVDAPVNGKPGVSQPPVPPRPGSSPLNRRPSDVAKADTDEKERKATDDDEGKEPTLRQVMDAINGVTKRMDALEKGKDDDDETAVTAGPEAGLPVTLAADAARAHKESFQVQQKHDRLNKVICTPSTQDLFTAFQARADKVYSIHGMQAEAPVYKEELSAYRRRLLQPLKHMSAHFKHADLRVLAVDGAGFKVAEDSIYSAAEQEGRNPKSIPPGILREQSETRHGHTYTKFFGRPSTWMGPMMGMPR